jgi:hypothetical protein
MGYLVASDIDGTLLRSDDRVSPRTIGAVRDLTEAGGTFVYATGRPPRWVEPIADLVGHRGLAICSNGALVLDLRSGDVLLSRLLDAADARSLVARICDGVPGATFAVDAPGLVGHDPAYRPRWAMPAGHVVAPIMDLLSQPVIKVLVRVEGAHGEDLMARTREVLGADATVTRSSDEGLVEVVHPQVTKASALAFVAGLVGMPRSRVVALGDMPNDIEMLAWAGVGVAMGNAHPSVLAAADEQTAHHDDDGVALVIERLVGELRAAAVG